MSRSIQAAVVVVRRVRPRGEDERRGFMTALPRVGEPMSLYANDQARTTLSRLVRTTPVRRILVEESGLVAFVETDNSVYRVSFDKPFLGELPAASVRLELAPDGSGELTVFADAEENTRPRRSSGSHPIRGR
jgi:hypothetical protein